MNNLIKKGFDDALSLFSLFGFVALALFGFFGVNLFSWQTTILMILAGAGLMIEGNIVGIRTWLKDGIQKGEAAWMLSIVVGIIAIIVGIIKLPFLNIINPKLDVLVAIIATFSGIFIALQRWIIK